MPRTKEAIAILRGFCKHESKQKRDGVETGDALFAQGILAAIRWMTEKDSPAPYAELEEDMPESGGWETPAKTETKAVPSVIYSTEQQDFGAIPTPPPPVRTPQFETPSPFSIIIPGEEPPDPNINKKLAIPGSFSAALEEQPWLKEYVKDIGYLQVENGKMTMPNDSNAVIVGRGLESGPSLAGGGE